MFCMFRSSSFFLQNVGSYLCFRFTNKQTKKECILDNLGEIGAHVFVHALENIVPTTDQIRAGSEKGITQSF